MYNPKYEEYEAWVAHTHHKGHLLSIEQTTHLKDNTEFIFDGVTRKLYRV